MVAELPVGTYSGAIAVIAATGLFTSNVTAPEEPPPGAGLCTVIRLAELPVRSAAGRAAVSSVLLTTVVRSGALFQLTAELARKLVPFTSRVVVTAPAVTLVGLTLVIVGTGFKIGGGIGGAVVVPPQPLMSQIQATTGARGRHAARFIEDSYV
jgi:hypothetical protein